MPSYEANDEGVVGGTRGACAPHFQCRRRSERADGLLAVVATVGRPPHLFGKNDECGFLPKAATPGWK
jgi:hypothetical protein